MPIAITKDIKITLPNVYDGDAKEVELEEDPDVDVPDVA